MIADSYTRPYRRKYGAPDLDSETSKQLISKSTSKSPSSSINELQDGHGKLAQEIQDELLICKICLGNYKQPKSLSCLHTFCEDCLESHIQGEVTYKKYSDYRDFTCPLCRKRTSLPVGGVKKLPDNFVVASLFDMIQKRKSSVPNINDEDESKILITCQICQNMGNKRKEAQTKCIDCAKLMCRSCTEMHKKMKVTKLHSLFDLNIEEEVICKIHNEESVRFYCEPCETCICVLCTFNDHRDHEVTQFTEAVVKYKTEIENEKIECQNIILEFEEKIEKIKKVELVIKTTETQINNLTVKLASEIQNKENQLLEEIRNIYGDKILEIIKSKSEMELQLAELKNTCNMADMVLQRKDVELLLLKKEIQKKLLEMHRLTEIELPSTINKEVKFIAGILDFGSIQDMDRPWLTRPRSYKEFLENKEQKIPEKIHTETQTDPVLLLSKSVSTVSIQMENKGVNTRSRIIHQKMRANSLQALGDSLYSLEVQPIVSTEDKMILYNSDQISLSPNIVRRPYNNESNRITDTKDLILNASDILSNYIANSNLDAKYCAEIEEHIPISDF